jgi:hypothetical protein
VPPNLYKKITFEKYQFQKVCLLYVEIQKVTFLHVERYVCSETGEATVPESTPSITGMCKELS